MASNGDAANERRIRSIVIVGGGTAGWLSASMLARAFLGTGMAITVIESPLIGTIGVGEATIPPIIDLLKFLNIDEADFVRHTHATYKLGIRFQDWRNLGYYYWHPFGGFGAPINRRPFFHSWNKARAEGLKPEFNAFSVCTALAEAGRFCFPAGDADSAASGLRYALHFDATLVAKYLRSYAERLGVCRIERTIAGATLRQDGAIDALRFEGDAAFCADLYLDCSGFGGLLIEQALGTGYVAWTDLLPCDRAVAFPTELTGARAPYTQSLARGAGWQWRIPLQHRVGNGYVYSSAHCADEQALADLQSTVEGSPQAEPRFLRFKTGRRKSYWNRNCVSLGLASGFLEPLESTSIHLVTSGVFHLLEHFPDCSFDQSNIDSYNEELTSEAERVRDFIVLHYCLTRREDTAFWRDCRAIEIPDSLHERIERYRRTGRIRPRSGELFTDVSWFYIFEGMGVVPESGDPLLDVLDRSRFEAMLMALAHSTTQAVRRARPHDSYFTNDFAGQGANVSTARI